MPRTPSLSFQILLFLFSLSTFSDTLLSATADTLSEQFREAPEFYNSVRCPSLSTVAEYEDTFLCSENAVHVAMTLDLNYIRGSMAAILSILQHSLCPQNVIFHFVAPNNSSTVLHLQNVVVSSFPYLKFDIYIFDTAAVAGLISTSIRSALDCPLNYARSYLANILPLCVRKIVYLDSDIILVDDITKLAGTPLIGGAVLAAPEYCNANFTSYFTPTFWSNPSLSVTFSDRIRNLNRNGNRNRNRIPCYFNTGVMVIDLDRWREGDYTAKIEEWMEIQKETRIYELGSLPPFLLVFAGKIAPVDHRWNQHGLGGDNFRGLCRDLHPGPVSLLHWSGKGKPWDRLDARHPCPLDALWAPYDLLKPPPFLLD